MMRGMHKRYLMTEFQLIQSGLILLIPHSFPITIAKEYLNNEDLADEKLGYHMEDDSEDSSQLGAACYRCRGFRYELLSSMNNVDDL